MAERYTKLLPLPDDQYTPGAPVLIAAGSLLRDNETGKILVQLKFRNISPKEIVALKVSIAASDVTGQTVPGVSEYQYLDLKAGRDAMFGQKQAIVLPDSTTRNVEVSCTSAIFTDGTPWTASPNAKWRPMPKQKRLAEVLKDTSLAEQYRRDTTERSLFLPLRFGDLWLCACGGVNRIGEKQCHACKMEMRRIVEQLNVEGLRQRAAAYERTQSAAKARKRKRTLLISSVAAAVAAVAIAAALLITQVILPASRYRSAIALMDRGDYLEAIDTFRELENYKDAEQKIVELLTILRTEIAPSQGKISVGLCHTVGLKADGTVVVAGYNSDGQCDVSNWSDIVAIAAGDYHTVGLKADGTVVAAGHNHDGQCDVSGWSDIVAIAASESHTVGLKADGTVVAAGYNDDGQCDVSGWSDIVAIVADVNHTIGLKADGTVVAAGYNGDGQCDVSDWSDIVAIAAGVNHTVGLKANGTVIAVGDNPSGECDVSGWSDIVAVSSDWSHTVGLKADGTVVAAGYNDDGQCDVSGWSDIVAIAAGDYHTVGLKADGTVVATGDKTFEQCNVSDWANIGLVK